MYRNPITQATSGEWEEFPESGYTTLEALDKAINAFRRELAFNKATAEEGDRIALEELEAYKAGDHEQAIVMDENRDQADPQEIIADLRSVVESYQSERPVVDEDLDFPVEDAEIVREDDEPVTMGQLKKLVVQIESEGRSFTLRPLGSANETFRIAAVAALELGTMQIVDRYSVSMTDALLAMPIPEISDVIDCAHEDMLDELYELFRSALDPSVNS